MRTLFITDTLESALRAGFDPNRKMHRRAFGAQPQVGDFLQEARVWWPRPGFTLQDADLLRHTIWDVVVIMADIERNMTWPEREQFRELVAVYLTRDPSTILLSF